MNSPAIAQDRPVSLLRGLVVRFEGLRPEVGKFGVVGGICYGIDFGIFNLLLFAGYGHFLALSVSTVIAATLAFVGNRFWTWRHRERSGLHREYPLFFGVNLVGLGIGFVCLWVTHDWLGGYWPFLTTKLADNLSGKVIGVGLASLFRFWAYRRFVFRADPVPAS